MNTQEWLMVLLVFAGTNVMGLAANLLMATILRKTAR